MNMPPSMPMNRPDLSRRYFFSSAAAVAGLALAGRVVAKTHKHKAKPAAKHVAAPSASHWSMGVQLWTVNAQMKTDPAGTLKALKGLGFETVETAGLYGATATALKTQIHDAGLACRAYHVSMGELMAGADTHINNAQTLGATWLVCSSPQPPAALDPATPWVTAMYNAMTLDAWKQNAEHVATLAPVVNAGGLKFAYHNHPMEFRDLGGGVTGYGLLADASDLLRLEMDIGWVAASGNDPVAMLHKYAGRVDLLHVKDMVKDPAAPLGYRSVEVGSGFIDWKAVFAAAHATKVQGYFIEQEEPYLRPVLESLQTSSAYVRRL